MTIPNDEVARIARGAVDIPPGMVPWDGGGDAPDDWDGGPYLCRDGKLYHMRGYGWGHGTNCYNATADWDRIAYTPVAVRVIIEADRTLGGAGGGDG